MKKNSICFIKNIFLAMIFFASNFFCSCDLFNETPKDFLQDYGTIVYVKSVDIDGAYVVQGDTLNVTQSGVSITYFLENPYDAEILSDASLFDLSELVSFPKSGVLADAAASFSVVDNSTLKLSLPTISDTTADGDSSRNDISPTIWIYRAADGRPQSSYTVKIRYNSPAKLAPPTADTTSITNTQGAEYGVFTIKTSANAPNAIVHYVILDAAGNVAFSGAKAGDAPIHLYPEENGDSKTYNVSQAYATLSGFFDSDDGNIGNISVEGVKIDAPTSNYTGTTLVANEDGIAKYILTAADGAEIKYSVKDSANTEIESGTKKSPVTIELAPGTYSVTASASKKYYKDSDEFSQANINVKGPPIIYADSSAQPGGNGSKAWPFNTIQYAVDEAALRNTSEPDDYIIYAKGTFTAQSGQPVANISSAMTLSIIANSSATLSGNGESVIQCSAGDITLKNLNITGGNAAKGGGINFSGTTLLVEGGTISNNTATTDGGGIYVLSGTVTVKGGATIENNTAANYGGGVSNSGTFSMTGGTIGKNKANFGGGIWNNGNVSATTTTMNGVTINNNTATTNGGGVFNTGTFTIENSTISENSATGGNGGGVYNGGGTFTMTKSTVTKNDALNGGGVCTKSIFTMEGGTISGNKANVDNANNNGNGGGAYIEDGGSFTMESGVIGGGNEAKNSGGGAYIKDGGTFTMKDGLIGSTSTMLGNKAATNGSGVYSDGSFNMSGAAKITSDNDVYLSSGKYITVASALTGTTPVATITPAAYPSGTTQVKALDGTAALVAGNHAKFAVSDDASGGSWIVDSAGNLAKPTSGGTITVVVPDTGITYNITETPSGTDTTIAIKILASDGSEITPQDFKLDIWYGTDLTGQTSSATTFTISNWSAWPSGNYVFKITFKNGGITYSDEVPFTKS